jgi:hypothetical protein
MCPIHCAYFAQWMGKHEAGSHADTVKMPWLFCAPEMCECWLQRDAAPKTTEPCSSSKDAYLAAGQVRSIGTQVRY